MKTSLIFFCAAAAAVSINSSFAQDYDKIIDGSGGAIDARSAADLTGPSGLLSKLDLGSTDATNPAIVNILEDITFAATEGTADQRLASPFVIDPNSWNGSAINEYRYAKIGVATGKTLVISGNTTVSNLPNDTNTGGAIRWGAGNLELGNTGNNAGRIIFKNNSVAEKSTGYAGGGAIYAGDNSNLTINNADFENNKINPVDSYSESGGGAILTTGNLHIANSSFIGNSSDVTDEKNYTRVSGGAVYVKSYNYNEKKIITIENTIFDGNTVIRNDETGHAGSYGGAICIDSYESQTVIKNSRFLNNKSSGCGGAIFTEGQLVLENTDFIGNNNFFTQTFYGGGSAIYANGGIKISGGTFENNGGMESGGAIHWNDYSYGENNTRLLDINGTKFTNNLSGIDGGAITSFGNVKIINAEFVGNKTNGAGGAIDANASTVTENDSQDYSHFFYIENSVFRENKTVKSELFLGYQGGAISYQSSKKGQLNGIIKDTIFLDNSAQSVGGAVYAHGSGTLKFEVSTGKNLISKGNVAIYGGFLDMGYRTITPDGPPSEWPEGWENNRTDSPEVIFEIGQNATYTIGSADDRSKDDISGDGILRKTGKGTLILNAENDRLYTQTIVDEGKLVINGILGGSGGITIGDVVSRHSLTVNNGGILGGSGKISGETTINAGGVLAPGNSPGTITFDKLIVNDGAILDIEKGDLIVADELDLSNLVNGVEVNFTGFSQGDTVRLFSVKDITGIDLETADLNDYFSADGFDFFFDADTNSIMANFAIPEPAAVAAMLGAFTLAFAMYRRRK